MSETPGGAEGPDFVVPKSEEELNQVEEQNATVEQSRASKFRKIVHNTFGKEQPTLELDYASDGSHINSRVLRGTVGGVELEIYSRQIDTPPKNWSGPTITQVEYSGTMNGQSLKPEDAQLLYERYGMPMKGLTEEANKEAAESILPKEVPEDAYQQTLDTLLSNVESTKKE